MGCSPECSTSKCTGGSLNNEGLDLVNGVCHVRCSQYYGATRYCGSGSAYEGADSVDCTSCCSPECTTSKCTNGDFHNGGLELVNGVCTVRCSRYHGSTRYCGDGPEYEEIDSVDCTGCSILEPTSAPTPTPISVMPDLGTNLPPTQSTTSLGAFLPGAYRYDYKPDAVAMLAGQGFSALRLPINVATANNASVLAQLQGYIDMIGRKGILCMFDENYPGDGKHGDGRVNDPVEMAAAWKNVHTVFENYADVKYELFNEPYGYNWDGTEYYSIMTDIISSAGLPSERVILDGLNYADRVQTLVDLGWTGFLGYHFYPWYVDTSLRTQDAYYNKLMDDIGGISTRVFITEFGGTLDLNYTYVPNGSPPTDANIMKLRALQQGLLELKLSGAAIMGAYHWHGWHNSDTFDFWECANANGATMISQILADIGDLPAPNFTAAEDPPATCPQDCISPSCQAGSWTNGGEILTGQKCVAFCKAYGETRYCGRGDPAYEGGDSADCSTCACPAPCDGLPCGPS